MDPSILKLRQDDKDEVMHSVVDKEDFQAALTVLTLGNKNTSSQSLPEWPSPSHDSQADSRNQEPKAALLQVQHSLEVELKQHESLVEQLQHDASQDVNNPPLSQKQSQDECHQEPTVQVSLQKSQAIGIQNSGKDSVLNVSQYVKLQQINNQQPTVNEQPNKQNYRILKNEILKDSFKQSVKDAVRDQVHRMVIAKVELVMEKHMRRLREGHAGQQHPVSMPTVSSGSRLLNDKSPKKRKKANYVMTKSMKSEVSVGSKKGSHSDIPAIDSDFGEDAPSLKSPRKEKEQTSNNGDKSETQEVPSPKRLRIEHMEKKICCPKPAVKGANKSTERLNVSTSSPQHAPKDDGPDEESTLSAPSLRIKSLKFSHKGIEIPDSTSSSSKSKLKLDDQPQIGSFEDHPRQSLEKTPQFKEQGNIVENVVESSSPPKVPGKLDQDQYLSSFDFFVYKQLLEEDPLAIMDKLLNGDLCQSSKALTTQTESTQNDDSLIEHLLKELKELAFSTQRPLTECLPFYPDLQSKIKILLPKLDRRMKDLTLEQLSFLSDFNNFFTDFLANIEASRTNYQQLEEFKSQHQDSLSKLRASKEKLSKFGESMEAGQIKVKTIDIQIRDLQAQISQLEHQVKTLEREKDLLRLKCVEKTNEVIKEVKGISSDALHQLKKISELEQSEKLLYAKSDELRDAYAHLKSKLPF